MISLDEFRDLDDLEDIKDFIELDPPGTKIPFNPPPFVPGKILYEIYLQQN